MCNSVAEQPTAVLKNSRHGFTLLEILLVLLIFSLIGGVVTPNVIKIYESFREQYQRENVLKQISDLGFTTLNRGKGFSLSSLPGEASSDTSSTRTIASPIQLPVGWSIKVQSPIVYLENGVCLGGAFELISLKSSYSVQLNAPYCQPYDSKQ